MIIDNGASFLKKIHKHFSGFPTMTAYTQTVNKIGNWDLDYFERKVFPGYYSTQSNGTSGIALKRNGVTWMSCTPMEVESHLLAQHGAKGKVVVAGLGLGLITMSLLKKHQVKELIVLEIDKDLIEGYPLLLSEKERALFDENISSGRLKFFQADCTKSLDKDTLTACRGADYMWVDTWEFLGSEKGLEHTLILQEQIKAKAVDYWGLELDLVINCARMDNKAKQGKRKSNFMQVVEKYPVPISAQSFDKKTKAIYFELCLMAGKNCVELIHSK
ncbi:TPA: hypothetical protein I7730_15915 [Vibrio vulnificus]|uniref:Spermidine synthase n=1 Tax=Vibrio vulnificus TaxID=672 RepID=A0A8H9TG74_VIBVL|nr:hypothetical protein [Vibrio vulnificus]HAS8541269.1 hypothetical protein [Vibrio vulnificus]